MQLIVTKVYNWKPGKYKRELIKTAYFKSTDSSDKRKYKVNLTNLKPERTVLWEPYLVKGNILDVVINPEYSDDKSALVNMFAPFTITRDINKLEKGGDDDMGGKIVREDEFERVHLLAKGGASLTQIQGITKRSTETVRKMLNCQTFSEYQAMKLAEAEKYSKSTSKSDPVSPEQPTDGEKLQLASQLSLFMKETTDTLKRIEARVDSIAEKRGFLR